MILDFLLSWSQLNLFFLLPQQQKDLANSSIPLETATYFEYSKIKKRYWTEKHLLDQIKFRALLIGEILYPRYKLLFIFDNIINLQFMQKMHYKLII